MFSLPLPSPEVENGSQGEGRSVCCYSVGRLAGRQASVVSLKPSSTPIFISSSGKDAVGQVPGPAQGFPLFLVASKSGSLWLMKILWLCFPVRHSAGKAKGI